MREATCIDCGKVSEVRGRFGPLPLRCDQCRDIRTKLVDRRRNQRRHGRPPSDGPREVTCIACGVRLEWGGNGRPASRCDPCRDEWTRTSANDRRARWAAEFPEKARAAWREQYKRRAARIKADKLDESFWRKHGISREDRDRLLAEQDGKCAICRDGAYRNHRGDHLHVDRCDETDRVRGLLCGDCTMAIGLLSADPALLAAALKYLQEK